MKLSRPVASDVPVRKSDHRSVAGFQLSKSILMQHALCCWLSIAHPGYAAEGPGAAQWNHFDRWDNQVIGSRVIGQEIPISRLGLQLQPCGADEPGT